MGGGGPSSFWGRWTIDKLWYLLLFFILFYLCFWTSVDALVFLANVPLSLGFGMIEAQGEDEERQQPQRRRWIYIERQGREIAVIIRRPYASMRMIAILNRYDAFPLYLGTKDSHLRNAQRLRRHTV